MFDYVTIAKAFPDTKKHCPEFPDRTKTLELERIGGNMNLMSFCYWNEIHLPELLGVMKLYIKNNFVADKEKIEAFHSTFALIVVHVWMTDKFLDKLEKENYFPGIIKGLRRNMEKILRSAIELEIQGDKVWLGEHADWWVPVEFTKRREIQQQRKKK